MNTVKERVAALRAWMKEKELDAFVVPTSDPHNSEYTADHWKCREWITGFDGSAGLAIVTMHSAALWTDSRYFLQAEKQLQGSPFVLMREGLPETPTPQKWLHRAIGNGFAGCDEGVFTKEAYKALQSDIHGYEIVGCNDPFAEIWTERPALPATPIYRQPETHTGCTTQEKISKIWQEIESAADNITSVADTDYFLVSDLSEIAWVLNLRASDVAYNPVFIAYLLIGRRKSVLFTELSRVSPEIREYLRRQKVEVRPYGGLNDYVDEMPDDSAVFGFTPQTPQWICTLFDEELGFDYDYVNNPIPALRAIKNQSEIKGFRKAVLLDGVALVRFHRWLDEQIKDGKITDETEYTIARRLEMFRSESNEFIESSFATISGYGQNGAVVHYEAVEENAERLQNKGFLLLDSGSQYLCGTTDITRTIPLGTLTEEERKVYTLVLKGHIALARAQFPEGTTGIQLDLAARYAMWQEGYDFGHGTGHGVGSHLCVHEGPQQIRKNLSTASMVAFQEGMTITNEPGIYIPDKFGVRIENMLLVDASEKNDFGTFLHFETLTLCPIDISPIYMEMIEESERVWLNDYHTMVRTSLLPLLSDETDKSWLMQATAEI